MLIKALNYRCRECRCEIFHHLGFGGDGACDSWVVAQCKKCGKQYELGSDVDYEQYRK